MLSRSRTARRILARFGFIPVRELETRERQLNTMWVVKGINPWKKRCWAVEREHEKLKQGMIGKSAVSRVQI